MEDFRLFILPDCPYCRRVLAWQEELLAAQPLPPHLPFLCHTPLPLSALPADG